MKSLAERPLFSERLGWWVFVSYGVFLLGFFFFPERPLHYKFYDVAVLLPGLFLAFGEFPLLWKDRLFKIVLGWLFYQLLSSFWSTNFNPGAFMTLLGWWLQVVLFILITSALVRRFPEEFIWLLKALVVTVALSALVSIAARHYIPALSLSRLEPLGRIDNAILAGNAYGVFALLALHFLVSGRTLLLRIVYVAVFLLLAAAILLTHSRTAMLGLLAALLVTPVCFGRKAMLATLALTVGVIVVAEMRFPGVFNRFYMELYWRPLIWEGALAHIKGAPWLGYGYLSDASVMAGGLKFQHAHSSYLGFVRDGGLVGLAIFLAMVAAFVVRIVRRGCHQVGFLIPLLVFALVVIAPDVDRLIVRPKELWLFFWWPLALFLAMSQSEPVSDTISAS